MPVIIYYFIISAAIASIFIIVLLIRKMNMLNYKVRIYKGRNYYGEPLKKLINCKEDDSLVSSYSYYNKNQLNDILSQVLSIIDKEKSIQKKEDISITSSKEDYSVQKEVDNIVYDTPEKLSNEIISPKNFGEEPEVKSFIEEKKSITKNSEEKSHEIKESKPIDTIDNNEEASDNYILKIREVETPAIMTLPPSFNYNLKKNINNNDNKSKDLFQYISRILGIKTIFLKR